MTSLRNLLPLSRRVAADAAREPELCRAAVAWTFLNRAREAASHARRHGVCHPEFGDGSVRDACLRGACPGARPFLPPLSCAFNDPALCRALATACLVSCRDIADPTCGATHYHHHADSPDWSLALKPVALIGSYLFYRAAAPCPRSAP